MSDKKKFRKKKAKLENTSEVLQSFFKKSPLSQQFTRWQVWNDWADIVGSQISSYSSPINYVQGSLTLWVEHPVHMQNLQFIEADLKKKINDHVGRRWVHRIIYDLNRTNRPDGFKNKDLLKQIIKSES